MSLLSNRQSVVPTTTCAGFDSIIREFTDDLRRDGFAESTIISYPGPSRHFLIWLELGGIALEAVDGTVIDLFLQHDCDCRAAGSAPVYPWRKRRT